VARTTVDNRWPVNAPDRLCWHTIATTLQSGWRSGSNIFLNGSADFRRVIFEPGPLPSVQVSAGDVSIVEGDGSLGRSVQVPISLSEPSPTDVSIAVELTLGSATGADKQLPGVDYKRKPIKKTVTFKVNPRTGVTPTLKHVGIPIYPDLAVEGLEDLGVNLYNVSLNATIARRTGAVGIIDDDPASGVAVSAGDTTVMEGNTGMRAVKIFVTLSAPQADEITVDYVIDGESATCAKVMGTSPPPSVDCHDFGGVVRRLVLAPGHVVKPVTVKLYPDTAVESAETVAVTLLAARPTNGATPLTVDVDRSATITILDDDTTQQ
jgi:hypothetical protein